MRAVTVPVASSSTSSENRNRLQHPLVEKSVAILLMLCVYAVAIDQQSAWRLLESETNECRTFLMVKRMERSQAGSSG